MRRRSSSLGRAQEGKGSHERWLLTYADMITLLLAFFVVIFSLSNQDLRKYAMLARSIQAAFNLGQLKSQVSSLDLGGSAAGAEPGFNELAQVIAFENMRTEMESFAKQQGLMHEIFVTETPEGIAITFSGDLLFPSGRAKLKPSSLRALDKVAQMISPLTNSIRVEGHTDNVPVSGAEFPTNWELSAARATNVLRYLMEFGGIAPDRLSAMGWGENKPLESNDTPQGLARNRRAEILIVYPSQPGGGEKPTGKPTSGGPAVVSQAPK